MLKSYIYEFIEPFYMFVCFLSDTIIICPDTENRTATYHNSLNGNSDFDVVYLRFQNTSTQASKIKWAVISGSFVFCTCAIKYCIAWEKMSALHFYLFSCSVQGKKTCLIPGRFSTFKVNAYYVCFNTEYRWLKGCGKQIPLKKVVFFCYMYPIRISVIFEI